MLLALTGGIATGKSTVARLLAERHAWTAFDADACVHHLLDSDSGVQAKIVAHFGPKVRRADGSIDRTALRNRVFADPAARRHLEGILHPLVRHRWKEQAAECAAGGHNFLADIPLLFETGAETCFDASLTVASCPATQAARLAARGIKTPVAQAMLASQLPIEEKIRRADHVVWNDGTEATLARQVDLLLELLFTDHHAGPLVPH